jgi:regulator of protease activity HflC (stomatin/prohibitin superfamily)
MISFVLSILAIAGLAIAGFGVFMITQAVQRRDSSRSGVLLTLVGVVIAAIFFITSAGVVEVQANEVGVVFNTLNGELADTPLGPGMHIIIPGIQEVTIYSVAQQEYTMSGKAGEGAVQGDDAVEALTNDGQQVRLDVTIIYRISPSKANDVHVNWQNRYQNGLVRPTIRSVAREVVGQFNVQEIYSEKRTEVGIEIQNQAETLMARDGLEVIDVLVRNIVFSQEYVDSIEQKQVAQQQALEAQFRVEQKKQEAEQAREEARGKADAARIEAEGEADALQLINAQLSQNPALIQWRYIENLSDNVQLILLPSSSPFLFDLQSLIDASGTAVTPTPPTGSE